LTEFHDETRNEGAQRKMFKRILVPLDGSPRAEEALPVAARIARAGGGSIILVRVVSTVAEYMPSVPAKPALFQTVSDTDRVQAESYLSAIASSDRFLHIPVETQVLFGLIAPTILSVAAYQRADLIVICSHGLSGATRWVMGSVAEKVARYGNVPVFVLRESGVFPPEYDADNARAVRVLVPLDGSEYARAALKPAAYLAAALASPAHGTLHLVQVAPPVTNAQKPLHLRTAVAAGRQMQEHVEELQQYLDETANALRKGSFGQDIANLNLDVTSSVVVDDDEANAIIRTAEHGEEGQGRGDHSDAIAMATHGRSGLQRWATGSNTGRVLEATRLPMLVVRPPEFTQER
jgi:nucleotide-binding universal stress UspA family protein